MSHTTGFHLAIDHARSHATETEGAAHRVSKTPGVATIMQNPGAASPRKVPSSPVTSEVSAMAVARKLDLEMGEDGPILASIVDGLFNALCGSA